MSKVTPMTAEPVVMRFSPMAKLTYLAGPGTVGFFLLFFGLAVPTIPGQVVGVLGIAAGEYFLFRFLLRRCGTRTAQNLLIGYSPERARSGAICVFCRQAARCPMRMTVR
jgi:hypothetical protein